VASNTSSARWLTARRAALCFSLLVAVVACALPLTRTFGPESALLFALALSPWASALAAKRALHAERLATGPLLCAAIADAWWLFAIPVALLALNGLRVDPCDPIAGLRFLLLGPWAGLTLAAVIGSAVGAAGRTLGLPRTAITIAALTPFGEIVRALYDFVASPAIFAFGHFFGYFPGTFYDRHVEIPDAWLTQRALGALIGCGVWALLTAARDPESGRLSARRLAGEHVRLAFALALGVLSTWATHQALALHHRTSSRNVSAQLGRAIDTPHCHVMMPRELPEATAQRIAEECEFLVGQLTRTLGVEERSRISAFFFRSPEEKRDLMGAARVYIAKPWRREVYLQLGEYPHPVLAHELAHVVARNVVDTPFGVPGRLGGLVPEPTLVEGMAVALEPVARDELTAHQWAKAAFASEIAPPLSSLLGVDFFGTNQQLAYTLAGSFLRFVLETRGAEALRKTYARGVEAGLGKPFPALEREWKAYLANVALPERAQALAKLRFERPGVWSQVCPHVIEQLEGELGAALNAGDLARALEKCQAVLEIDPASTQTRTTLITLLAQLGNTEDAARQLKRLEGPPRAPTPIVVRAKVGIADAAFARGEYARAEASYRALLDDPQPEGDARQLEVKLLALQAGEPARSLLRDYLVGEPFGGLDGRLGVHILRELAQVREDGLSPYLEARQLRNSQRFDVALSLLREAQRRGLPTERMRAEALRMQIQAAFITGALSEAEALATQLAQREGSSEADRLLAGEWRERIAFRRSAGTP
jgi:tetratricopeptide (TPR) repeat protein